MNHRNVTIVQSCLKIVLYTVSGFAFIILNDFSAIAQIIPDKSFGRNHSSVQQDILGLRIEGGRIRNENLFHSFSDFNVREGEIVYFENPPQVENIFSRVTGNNPSQIQGALGVDGPANLFILNPNGVVFGPNALLNVEGTFLATSSSHVFLEGGESFGVGRPNTTALLMISVPIGLQFSVPKQGDIITQGSLFTNSQMITFIGNTVNLQGDLSADSRIQLLGRNLILDAPQGFGILFSAPDVRLQASETVTLEGPINTSSSNLSFQVTAGDSITLAQDIGINGDIELVSGGDVQLLPGVSVISDGNDIAIDATDDVYIEGGFTLGTPSIGTSPGFDQDTVDAGDIFINARSLTLENGAVLSTISLPNGNSGDISIQVRDDVSLFSRVSDSSPSLITSSVSANGQGDAGDIRIGARSLTLADGAQIQALLFGGTDALPGAQGEAGNIRIDATDVVRITGVSEREGVSSGLLSITELGTQGQTGNIRIRTGQLQVSDGGVISSPSFTAGSGGDIRIFAQNVFLKDGGQIISSAFGDGPAGSIVLNVDSEINISGQDPTFTARLREFGTDRVVNQGSASGLFSNALSIGNGGDIDLTTASLRLSNGGILSAQSTGAGISGNFRVEAETVLVNDSTIQAAAAESSGGRIAIASNQIRLVGDGDIQTSVSSGAGGAGDIRLRADSILALDDSDILAFADDGRGGNIRLNTPAFFGENFTADSLTANPDRLDGNDRVDINATGAVSGTVVVPDLSFLQNSLANLPENTVDTEALLASSCVARTQDGNTFLVTGAGGLPERPGEVPVAPYATGTVRTVPDEEASQEPRSWELGDPIDEPQGLYQLPDGRLILSQECTFN